MGDASGDDGTSVGAAKGCMEIVGAWDWVGINVGTLDMDGVITITVGLGEDNGLVRNAEGGNVGTTVGKNEGCIDVVGTSVGLWVGVEFVVGLFETVGGVVGGGAITIHGSSTDVCNRDFGLCESFSHANRKICKPRKPDLQAL